MTIRLLLVVLFLCAPLAAQHRVDPRNMYERVWAVVPMVGSGTPTDPMRPDYAPLPATSGVAPVPVATSTDGSPAASTLRPGIIAFNYVVSDDGTLALVEFVAVDRKAFKDLLADTARRSRLFSRAGTNGRMQRLNS